MTPDGIFFLLRSDLGEFRATYDTGCPAFLNICTASGVWIGQIDSCGKEIRPKQEGGFSFGSRVFASVKEAGEFFLENMNAKKRKVAGDE